MLLIFQDIKFHQYSSKILILALVFEKHRKSNLFLFFTNSLRLNQQVQKTYSVGFLWRCILINIPKGFVQQIGVGDKHRVTRSNRRQRNERLCP